MTGPAVRRRTTRRRKTAFSAVTLILFVLAAELSLAVLGVKPARATRDPLVGFAAGSPLFIRQGDRYVTKMRLLEKLHRDDEALQAYQRAIQAKLEDSHALARLGDFYGRRSDWATARDYLQQAVPLTPDKAPLAFRTQIRLQLGDCLQALGESAAVRDLYRQAVQLDANFPGLQERLHDRTNGSTPARRDEPRD